jgi:regulation of enolase protein 1 (concanavalin A-like superfamily)
MNASLSEETMHWRFLIAVHILAALGFAQTPFIQSENGRRPITPWHRAHSASEPSEPRGSHYWAAFSEAPDARLQAGMRAAGVELIGFAGRSEGAWLYKVRVRSNSAGVGAWLRGRTGYLNLAPIGPEEKLAARYYNHRARILGKARRSRRERATVFFHAPMPWGEAQALLRDKVDSVIYDPDPAFVHVVASPAGLAGLAGVDEVAHVGAYMPRQPVIDLARRVTRVSALQAPHLDTLAFPPTPSWNQGRPFTGEGIRICVNEGVDSSHLDFRESLPGGATALRKGLVETWTTSFHGTHVAGIAAGNGWNSQAAGGRPYQYRGVAPKAVLLPYWESGDVNNHSFTNGFEAYYNYADAGADQRICNHDGIQAEANNVAVWAAANNGGSSPQYGSQRGYYSMLVNAKNPIKVAASDLAGVRRACFSSMGPTRDGRIGPDVTAPGHVIQATREGGQEYAWMSGTSMACPHVSGIVALLLQKYKDEVLAPQGVLDIHNNPPWNSTLKAILVHTARDMVDTVGAHPLDASPEFAAAGFPGRGPLYGPGPDFATGYGMVDAARAAEFMDPARFTEASAGPGEVRSYSMTVPAEQGRLRVTLAWDDPPFQGVNDESGAYARKLVNDLDLRLIDPSGRVHEPWVLDHGGMNDGAIPPDGIDPVSPDDILLHPARKGKDGVNNLEVVDVLEPAPGDWIVEVVGYEVPVDQSLDAGVNQDFSLVFDHAPEMPSAPPGADLVVSSVQWTPAEPSPAERVRFRATLTNSGAAATPSGVAHELAFHVGGAVVARNTSHRASIQPGESVILDGEVGLGGGDGSWLAYSGVVPVSVSADPRNLIAENKEGNNARLELMEVPRFPRPWEMSDVGAPGYPGYGYFFDHVYYVTGEGSDIWGEADGFNFVHRGLQGGGEIRALIHWMDDTDPWAKAGVMIREDLGAGSRHAMLALTPGNGVAFQHRASAGGPTSLACSSWASPLHVRLVRSGDDFTGYVSSDGTAWTRVGSAHIPMASSVRVGMAVTSHLVGTSATGSFGQVEVIQSAAASVSGRIASPTAPALAGAASGTTRSGAVGAYAFSGLAAVGDIGNVGFAGGVEVAGGVHTVRGSGADIWGSADGFHFHSVALPADGEIVARVVSIRNTDPWAKAGVMMRDGMAPGARHAFMALTPGKGGAFQRRVSADGPSLHTSAGDARTPYWVRLTRNGEVFRGYSSADGVSWTLVGEERIPLSGEVRAGLAVTAHNNASLCTAAFDNVSVKHASDLVRGETGAMGVAGSFTPAGGVLDAE